MKLFILYHAAQLEHLELDFLDWADEVELYRILGRPLPASHLATEFFRLVLCEDKVALLALKSLSLSSVAFWGASAQLMRALNMRNLQTLKLRNCRGADELLDGLAHSSEVPRLTSFELPQGPGNYSDI